MASCATTSAMAVDIRRRSPQLKNHIASPMSSTAPATASMLHSAGTPLSRSTPRLTMMGSSDPAPAIEQREHGDQHQALPLRLEIAHNAPRQVAVFVGPVVFFRV